MFKNHINDGEGSINFKLENQFYRVNCNQCENQSQRIIHNRQGELVCKNCGLILYQLIDEEGEWRSFSSTDGHDPNRVGILGDPNSHQQYSTIIGHGGGIDDISLMRTQTHLAQTSIDKRISEGNNAIRILCDRMNLKKNVLDMSKNIFQKAIKDSKFSYGRLKKAFYSACVYLAANSHDAHFSFRDMEEYSFQSKSEIGKAVRLLRNLGLKPKHKTSYVSFIPRYCNLLRLQDLEKPATIIAKEVQKSGLIGGRSPISIQAVCIYIMILLSPTHKSTLQEIAEVTKITESTIRVVYKDFYPSLLKIIPPYIASKETIRALPIG